MTLGERVGRVGEVVLFVGLPVGDEVLRVGELLSQKKNFFLLALLWIRWGESKKNLSHLLIISLRKEGSQTTQASILQPHSRSLFSARCTHFLA